MNNTKQEKGLFLQEFYGVQDIPALVDEAGNPTKFAEAAKYWGESIPTNKKEVKQLVAKGAALVATENLSVSQKFSQNSVYGGRQNLSVLRDNKIKVPFVKVGEWKHDAYGEVKFTQDDLNQLVDNFNKGVVGFTPYLTLGHLDEEPSSTDSHRKRGDLQDIIIEGDTGYGVFAVNDDIYSSIQKGEYEYSSGEFNRRFTDKETGDNVGTAVIRVALTNSPFLPFGEQKVQALSDNSENCPETRENYVFLLSLDTSNSSNVSDEVSESAEEPKKEEPVKDEKLSETVESEPTQDIKDTKLTDNESIMSKENLQNVEAKEAVLATEAEPKVAKEEAAPAKLEVATEAETKVEKNQGDEVLANLTSQLQKVQDLYQKQLEAANKTIEALTTKVDELGSKLAGQEKVTQAFSTSMSQAQERSMIENLQNGGVLPATIQKFLAFKNAFENAENKNIVKFSVGAGEEKKEMQYSVVDTVADLLLSASAQQPLVEQQLGVSAGRKSGAFDFSSIIEKNKAAATKIAE